jgi:hypothetical protein
MTTTVTPGTDAITSVKTAVDTLAQVLTPPGGDPEPVSRARREIARAVRKALNSQGCSLVEVLHAIATTAPLAPPPAPPWAALLALTPEELVERGVCLSLELKWAGDLILWVGSPAGAPEWLDRLSGPRDAGWMHQELAAAGVPVAAHTVGKLIEVLNARVVAHRQAPGGA